MSTRTQTAFSLFAALAGCVVAISFWGKTSEQKKNLQDQLSQFSAMSPEQQSAIRRSFDDLGNQSEEKKREFEKIHSECTKNAELRNTLDDFFHWWTTLPQTDRNQFRELNDEKKLAFVESHASRGAQLKPDITIEFPGARGRQFETLNMTFEEYWEIISETLEPFEKPQSLQDDLDKLSRADQKSLRLTMWFFVEHLPETKDFDKLRIVADRCSEVFEKRLRDRVWADKFQQKRKELEKRPFGESWLRMMSFMVIDGATLALGNSLQKEFPVTEDQVLDAFSKMQDREEQYELMKMRPEEARVRLELLAQSGGSDSPIQRLLSQYNQFAAQRRRLMKLPMGFGDPFGGPSAGPGTGQPPGFRGKEGFDRRDQKRSPDGKGRDFPAEPPFEPRP